MKTLRDLSNVWPAERGAWDPGRVALEVAEFSDKLGERALEPAGRWVRGSLTAVRDKAHLLGKGGGQYRELFRSTVWEAYSAHRRSASDQEKPHASSIESGEVVAMVPPDRYVANATIWNVLAGGDTVLVKGSWLLKGTAAAPRRQDLEVRYPSALWKVGELAELVRTGSVAMVAVSYCWCSKEHPDPRGEQMQVIRETLRQFLNSTPLEDVAVFIDWCSLHQKPRSDEEEAAFSSAMRNVHVWYAHQGIRVWRLTQLPAGAQHDVPYPQRGWPVLEQRLSEMVTKSNFLLDLGQLDNKSNSWGHIVASCTPRRRPPLLPEAFVQELAGKTFSEEADRDFVSRTYSHAFNEVIAAAEELSFNELAWGDQEAQHLAAVLPRCKRLKKLTLYGNRIGEVGGMALVKALSQAEALEELWITNNPVTKSKDLKERLKSAWAETGKSDDSLHL